MYGFIDVFVIVQVISDAMNPYIMTSKGVCKCNEYF